MFSIARSARKGSRSRRGDRPRGVLAQRVTDCRSGAGVGRPAAPSEPRLLDLDATPGQALAETFLASDPIRFRRPNCGRRLLANETVLACLLRDFGLRPVGRIEVDRPLAPVR